MRAVVVDPALGITEACAEAAIVRQASLAGGLGACYAPNGEREGRSRLANLTSWEHEGQRPRASRQPCGSNGGHGGRSRPHPRNNCTKNPAEKHRMITNNPAI